MRARHGVSIAAACVGLVSTVAPSLARAADPAMAARSERGAQIGTASQESDGTIVLVLRAEGPGGLIGDGLIRYAPGDSDYAAIARHVGPIPKGGTVTVRAFPR